MHTFVDKDWSPLFAANGLCSFEDFWAVQGDWFEPPNQRRGGWSGVLRLELPRLQGGHAVCFLKRQENHLARTWRHLWQGIPTYLREFQMLQVFQRYRIPSLLPLFFGHDRRPGSWRAVLVTEALTDHLSLNALAKQWRSQQRRPPRPQRQVLIESVALLLRRLHQHRLRHGVLYDKHVFLQWPFPPDAAAPVRLIDLEKARRVWSSRRAMVLDLDVLNRHTLGWSRTDRLRFLKAYLQTNHSRVIRAAWQAIARRGQKRED